MNQRCTQLSEIAGGRRTATSGAQLLFRGASAGRLAGTLSDGERLRATAATLLLGDLTPQLLLSDEPRNNLDLLSVRHLISVLCS